MQCTMNKQVNIQVCIQYTRTCMFIQPINMFKRVVYEDDKTKGHYCRRSRVYSDIGSPKIWELRRDRTYLKGEGNDTINVCKWNVPH
jgi:hypothetical protein